MKAGECISVMKFVNADWALCFDPGKNMSGIIPVSFLNIFLNDEAEEEERDLTSESMPSPNNYPEPVSAADQSYMADHTSQGHFIPDWYQPKPTMNTSSLNYSKGDLILSFIFENIISMFVITLHFPLIFELFSF